MMSTVLKSYRSAGPWSFDGDGARFRLVSEAHRIRLAYLFDPVLAVHTSLVDPLPHQITAVYDSMLSRQPLRFLLADDPGAGKTIMAGLLIKELIVRGDLQRCLIEKGKTRTIGIDPALRDEVMRWAKNWKLFRRLLKKHNALLLQALRTHQDQGPVRSPTIA
jgi:hypothetical protein